ncbi:RING finger protein 32-like [Gigantopelta aegis]|uniref:RING finger protein 32-like n=1 Tax=Gigantopelta aegis TaxID=1735272 RepID=UPI001B88C5DC|nr:RING finger protein 32-like [Gigantopelta aegis]
MARNYTRRGTKDVDSTAMIAVALQDHWTRTLSLGLPRNPRNVRLGPATRMKLKKDVKPVVDTGRSKRTPKPQHDKEEEYVLDSEPPPLTLAQKFGLVDAPPQLMSETEWQNAKFQSNRREDSQQPCVICKEHFGFQEQVLLSCTHVFHRACLQAFERFTGRKTCPMCRREQYQTRVIHEGAKAYKQICATRIQSAWRGYVVRCWYQKLRESRPPQDPKLRKKFFEDKLKTITDRMVRSCDFNVNEFLREMDQSLAASRDVFRNFDAMFKEISDSEWEKIQLTAVERGHQECPICLTLLVSEEQESGLGAGNTCSPPTTKPKQKHSPGLSARDKPTEFVAKKGGPVVKGDGSVAKDIGSVAKDVGSAAKDVGSAAKDVGSVAKDVGSVAKDVGSAAKDVGSAAKDVGSVAKDVGSVAKEVSAKARHTVLLSCSHVFHETCLLMLEDLALGEIRNTCPICRAAYQKKTITF